MIALRRILLSIAALLALLLIASIWLLHTESGARFAVGAATRFLDGRLSTGAISGSIARGLRATDVRWRDADAGVDVYAGGLRVTLAYGALIHGTLRLNALAVRDVSVELRTVARPEPDGPASLEPPLDIIVEAFTLERGELQRDGAAPFVIERAVLAGEWTQAGIAVDHARVIAPQGKISLEARLGTKAPWIEHASGAFEWREAQRRWKGSFATLEEPAGISLRGGLDSPFTLGLEGWIARGDERPWRLRIELPRFDPREVLLPDGKLDALAAELEAHGAGNTANVNGHVDLNDERLSIRELALSLSPGQVSIDSLRVGIADMPGELRGSARIRLDGSESAVFAHLQADTLDLPARWVRGPLAISGEAFVDGNFERFESHGAVDVARGSLLSSIAWKADGSRRKIHLREGRVSQAKGELSVTGEVGLESPVSWRLAAAARGFDPSGLAPGWPGALDFRIDSHGELSAEGPRARLTLRDLGGRLRDRPVSGGGELSLEPDMRLGGQLGLKSGAVSLDVTGTHGATARIDAKLDVASFADWTSSLEGRAQVSLEATGRWPDTTFTVAANAQGMKLADDGIDEVSMELTLRSPLTPRFELVAKARGAALSGMRFDTISIAASGSEAAHQLSLDAGGHPLGLDLKLHGAYSNRRWSGEIDTLKLVNEVQTLALENPAPLQLAADAFELGQACLSGGDIRLCLAGSAAADGRFETNYSLRALPLEMLVRLAHPTNDLAIGGRIDGEGRVKRERDGSVAGNATLTSASGSIARRGEDPQLRLDYHTFELKGTFAGNTANASVSATLDPDGSISGDASVANLLGDDPTLEGELKVEMRDLGPVEWMLPQLTRVSGTGELTATLGGSPREPAISARLALRNFQADVPTLGIQLEKGELMASLAGDGSFDTRAQVTSGGGVLEVSGRSASLREIDLAIRGDQVLAANFPAAHLIVSPELTLAGSPDNLSLGGSITIPRASVDLDKMTNQGGAQISPDVVVIDRPERQARRRLAMHTDVRVVLGRDVKLTGFGLDAAVSGQLRVVERPGSPGTGSGEIRLDGTYEAFGRKLDIERGQMLFANSPLDNPQLDVLATRRMPDITAKLRVTGSARRPQLDVFTDPSTSPTEAMSYLLTGQSMSDLRGTEGERVEAAAQSLGGVLGDRLARGIAGKFGIDNVGVEQSDELGSSAFTVGKYLSPGFFVSYGVGLFQPGTVITLRYAISEHWSLEAVDSPNDQRGGINFRIER